MARVSYFAHDNSTVIELVVTEFGINGDRKATRCGCDIESKKGQRLRMEG